MRHLWLPLCFFIALNALFILVFLATHWEPEPCRGRVPQSMTRVWSVTPPDIPE
jgi:hypothetical protein